MIFWREAQLFELRDGAWTESQGALREFAYLPAPPETLPRLYTAGIAPGLHWFTRPALARQVAGPDWVLLRCAVARLRQRRLGMVEAHRRYAADYPIEAQHVDVLRTDRSWTPLRVPAEPVEDTLLGAVPLSLVPYRLVESGSSRFPLAMLTRYPQLKFLTIPALGPGRDWATAVLDRDSAHQVAMGLPVPEGLDWARGRRVVAPPGLPGPSEDLTGLTSGPCVVVAQPRKGAPPTRADLRMIVELATGSLLLQRDPRLEAVRHPYARASLAVLEPDGRVWTIYAKKADGWVLPGGHVEDGELPVDAALREFFEETGLRAVVVRALGTHYRAWATDHVFLGVRVGSAERQPAGHEETVDLRPPEQLADGDREWLATHLPGPPIREADALTGGRWVTLDNGQHAYIRDGTVKVGPKGLVGQSLAPKVLAKLVVPADMRKRAADRSGRYVKGAYGGHTRTSKGNVGEALVQGITKQLVPGASVLHLSAGPFASFPIDMIVGKYAVEVKVLDKQVTRHEIRMATQSIADKNEMAKHLGKTPLMVAVLTDYKAGTATILKREGFKRYPFSAMQYVTTVDLFEPPPHRAPRPGHEPTFKLLQQMTGDTKLVRKWQQRATVFAKNYAARGVKVRTAEADGEWDEQKHPRVPAGSAAGGEFTDGSTPASAAPPAAAVPTKATIASVSKNRRCRTVDQIERSIPKKIKDAVQAKIGLATEASNATVAEIATKFATTATAKDAFQQIQSSWNGWPYPDRPGGFLRVAVASIWRGSVWWDKTRLKSSDAPQHMADKFAKHPPGWIKPGDAFADVLSDWQKYAQVQYMVTQQVLKNQGITELTLYRGLHHAPPKHRGGGVKLGALSSFTDSIATAHGFGKHHMQVTIHPKYVFAYHGTGLGTHGEHEYVLIGNGEPMKVTKL